MTPQQRTTFAPLFPTEVSRAWWLNTLPLISWPLIWPAEPHGTFSNSWFNSYLSWRHDLWPVRPPPLHLLTGSPSWIQPIGPTEPQNILPFQAKKEKKGSISIKCNRKSEPNWSHLSEDPANGQSFKDITALIKEYAKCTLAQDYPLLNEELWIQRRPGLRQKDY